ncbi:MAG: serine/threonine protein phosphatase [Flavobacteriaceae bacterium]|nr:serine/threonine protein phosphatase [Flavobacteriaceae bacterium]
MRTIVIGDIHAGFRAIQQLINKINPVYTDRYIFLGDYVDGWSEAVETVDYLIEFATKYSCIFIRGNHDYLAFRYLTKKEENPQWLASGGLETKQSYAKISAEKKKEHISFYKGLKNYHIDEENRLFVHAGFTNDKGPRYEYFEHQVFWDRTLWEVAKSMNPQLTVDDPKYPKRLTLFKEIYIGHTPVTRIGKTVPLNFANLWNIDTGAAFKGPLSAIDIQTKEVWQTDPVWTLYPEEQGRN